MSDREYIKTMAKEADLYRRQGLLAESREKYLKLLQFLSARRESRHLIQLKEAIEQKIRTVDENLAATDESAEASPHLSKELQDLIRSLFSVSQTKEVAAMEGAQALLKFGQHHRALTEFRKLLEEGILPVVAAKNILLCLLSLSSADAAIAQFKQWMARETMSRQELKYIREFLERSLKERGLEIPIPRLSEDPTDSIQVEVIEPDISTVAIPFEKGRLRGQTLEFNVNFQFGNVVSIIVPAQRKELLESLTVGARFPHMSFYSAIFFFKGSGTLSSRTLIKQGPRQGDYILDIAIDVD